MLQVYVYRGDSWIPQRMQRTAVELRHMEATDVAAPGELSLWHVKFVDVA